MRSDDPPSPAQSTILAAAYVRMSTEHQQYSTSNQMDVIREYAKQRHMEIIRVYSDEGKSGLKMQGRDALTQMINDVKSGVVPFAYILVYDVSRWGRFQDADESAFLEFTCRSAGIAVRYCAEQFENDGSPVSTIVKGVKRAMAGEYSRELSSKVFQGACRLIQLGFKQGGTAGFGLRRMLVDQNGQHKGALRLGEQKSIQTDRVILVPGPNEEVSTVQWMYQAFVKEGKSEQILADSLNAKGIKTDFGRDWTRGTVHEVLTNEKYIGNNVYHRTSFKLKQKHVSNPPEKWIRADGAFEGIVDPTLFYTTQGIILARSRKLSDDEMLEKLKDVWKKHGHLSGILIDETEALSERDWASEAMNSVAGKVCEFWIHLTEYRQKTQPEVERMWPNEIAQSMDQILNGKSTAEQMGLVILGKYCPYVRYASPNWTTTNFYRCFDFEEYGDRAYIVWSGFIHYARLSRELAGEMPPYFQKAFRHILKIKERVTDRFLGLVAAISISGLWDVNKNLWLDSFWQQLEPKERRQWLLELARLLKGSLANDKDRVWKDWLFKWWKERAQGLPSPIIDEEVDGFYRLALAVGSHAHETIPFLERCPRVSVQWTSVFTEIEKSTQFQEDPEGLVSIVLWRLTRSQKISVSSKYIEDFIDKLPTFAKLLPKLELIYEELIRLNAPIPEGMLKTIRKKFVSE